MSPIWFLLNAAFSATNAGFFVATGAAYSLGVAVFCGLCALWCALEAA